MCHGDRSVVVSVSFPRSQLLPATALPHGRAASAPAACGACAGQGSQPRVFLFQSFATVTAARSCLSEEKRVFLTTWLQC